MNPVCVNADYNLHSEAHIKGRTSFDHSAQRSLFGSFSASAEQVVRLLGSKDNAAAAGGAPNLALVGKESL
jgi:hypothetical protein